jgi:hopanoid biosynthesis associated protein HpnK
MKRLVVTADDFGNDVAVNEAVEIAHRDGILTAASLMVGAPAATDAIARARTLPSLGVGLHLVLVDGTPVLPPETVSGLVDASGRFRGNMAAAGAAMFFLPATRRQLGLEIEAQFALFAATGLRLDHVNAHKHFHLHPTIAGLIASIGARYGLRAVRAPIEPGAPSLTDPWAKLVRRGFRAHGIAVPDAVFGLKHSGAMNAARLTTAIAHLPDGLSEIYLHPATRDDYPGHGPAYRHCDELAALLDPAVRAAVVAGGAQLTTFHGV